MTPVTAFPFVDKWRGLTFSATISSHSVGISSGFAPLGDTRKLEGLGKISFLFPVLPCQKAGTIEVKHRFFQYRRKSANPRRICTGVSILIAALSAVVEIAGLEPATASPPD